MKFIKLFIATVLFIQSLSFASAAVTIDPEFHPQGAPTISGANPRDEQGDTSANAFDNARIIVTRRILNIVLGSAGFIAVFFIIQNGFSLVISAGSEEVVTEKKKGLMWALLGLALIIFSYTIIRFIIDLAYKADQPKGLPPAQQPAAAAPAAPADDGEDEVKWGWED